MKLEGIVLESSKVRLEPLELYHASPLSAVASQPGLVKYSPSKIDTDETLKAYISLALKLRTAKAAIPFAVFEKSFKTYAGSTRFMNIDWHNKVLHIGSTWLGREFHGSGLNTEIKRLMIDFAFEELGFEKVEFRIDERNFPSRKAVEKLGAILEGVLRKNVYLTDGFKRNTCCYGLLPAEWEEVRRNIS
jgi:RimJ/RimL family protein N-acetyltransferase